jgi:flagellar assembly factor FliW
MLIQTSRFGSLEVDSARLLTFPRGILGFPNNNRFALVQTGENSGFYWLQAVERPELAFVVCDPRLFVADYEIPVKSEDLAPLGLADRNKTQVFVIVNRIDDLLTGNLQGPLVINIETREGHQLVLSDRRYHTRFPLMQIARREMAVSKSA